MVKRFVETEDVGKERKQYYIRTFKYLFEFNPNITFDNFTLKMIYDFDYFLRTKKQLSTNTVMQHHKVIKHFFNVMIGYNVVNENPYKGFKIRYEKTHRQFLIESEIEKIENLDTSKMDDYLVYARDMFLFSCYTGLRFSDIRSLKKINVEQENDSVQLRVIQQKTNDVVVLPLDMLFNGKPISILNKYLARKDEYIFPKMSNAHVNRLLKVIKLSAGIDKQLTFHVARHTFGTLLAKYVKDPYIIKQLMGHADIKTSMIYIHLSKEMLKEKLKNVDW